MAPPLPDRDREVAAASSPFGRVGQYERAPSAIPLMRLGLDETGELRTVNVEAKKLIGFTDEEIARMREQVGAGS